jgi:peptidoglycan-N-acetylglucosamine deacetylase
MIRLLPLMLDLAAIALPLAAAAAECPGHADALGVSRVMAIDAATAVPVGRKQFPATLPLATKELVLTFDDGPAPGTTERVLEALQAECVRATFFMLGRNVAAHPGLAKRVLAEGHTIGHHTFRHPLLSHMTLARAAAEIDHGIAAVDTGLYGEASGKPRTPFFRFPGFASSPAVLELLMSRGIAVFGSDLWASDWNPMSPERELALVLKRLNATGGGILLLHDPVPQTARMLPTLLSELKRRDFKVVHIVPVGVH